MAKIFVTGGAGYIGSHTVLNLLRAGFEVTVFDNLEYGSLEMLDRVKKLSGKEINFIKGDIKNFFEIVSALDNTYEAVIHFAGYKSVVESYAQPLRYFENNVAGSINLFKAMKEKGVKNIIFSSTGSVYGQPEELPVSEKGKIAPLSVYSKTKAIVESILEEEIREGINSVRLRYFNVAGADPSGQIGEDPNCLGNLIPRLFANLIGKHDLKIYGNNFPTSDGTQIRDYIHVADLAEAHVLAMQYLLAHEGTIAINLGTGKGTTVMELLLEVEKVTGKKINYEIGSANFGEPVEIYANPTLAKELLNWQAKYDYHGIVETSWNWYKTCPEFKGLVS
jgi:UDP-glucose 4-epimerase